MISGINVFSYLKHPNFLFLILRRNMPFAKLIKFNYQIAFLIVLAGIGCKSINPPPPSMESKTIPAPKQPNSIIDIPVSMDLKTYFQQAEAAVDLEFKGKETPCEGLRYEYLFKRSPFDISGSGNKINLAFTGKYRIDLDYCAKCAFDHCMVPVISGSCGIGEPLRKIKIGYAANISVLPDYKLKSVTTLTTLEPVDRCNLTVLNYDATEQLIGFVKPPLTDLGKEVDKKIGAIDIKPQVKELWKQISGEIALGSYGFLSLNPKTIGIGPLNMTGSRLDFSLALSAKPVLRTESTPPPTSNLPNLTAYTPGNGFRVCLDLFVSYDSLSKYIGAAVNGTVIKLKSKKFIIKKVDIYGIGNEKIVIKVAFGGTRKGVMYMVGTPSYQSLTNEFSIPDLAFDVKTKSLIFKMARWLFNDKISTAIREGVKYNFTPMIEDSRISLQKQLNHDFGSGITSKGTVNDLILQEIYPAKDHVILRVLSEGSLRVDLK
jgi:hypothetical protein